MTRGAVANHVYVNSEWGIEDHADTLRARSARARLIDVLARIGAEPTATETLRLAVDEHSSLPRLIAEYETLAHAVSIGAARWPTPNGRERTAIAGLITKPTGPLTAEYAHALQEREQLILDSIRTATRAALAAREPWTHDYPAASSRRSWPTAPNTASPDRQHSATRRRSPTASDSATTSMPAAPKPWSKHSHNINGHHSGRPHREEASDDDNRTRFGVLCHRRSTLRC